MRFHDPRLVPHSGFSTRVALKPLALKLEDLKLSWDLEAIPCPTVTATCRPHLPSSPKRAVGVLEEL